MTEKTIWQVWSDNADRNPDSDAIIHWKAGEEPFRWKKKALLDTAAKFSYLLKQNGVKRDQVCAIIIRHNQWFYPLYMGIIGLGAIPAVLAYPNPRLHPDKFRQGIIGMSQRSGLDYILTEKELEPIISPLIQSSTIKGMHFPLEWDQSVEIPAEEMLEIESARKEIKPSDPILLQHSSGTTGLQKPVLLSHRAVIQHVEYYSRSIQLTPEDKIVSWLPLYHDMGLIAAYHLPLAFGIPVVQIDPFEWVIAPVLQLEAISAEKATICWLPNFAYNMLADKVFDDELEGVSLASMRLFINCSEPVRAESHRKFIERFTPYNLNPLSLATCYAMAETTFAVTQSKPGEVPVQVYADREMLKQGKLKLIDDPSRARVCVSSGKVIDGCEVKIVGEKRDALPSDHFGEIAIKSVSMFDGYRNYPEKTAEVLENGWYYSGDYGFILDGECFVIGRKKDIIIVAGKNIYPEDVEDTVSQVEGVLPGRVIAFGTYDETLGTEVVCVIAESNITDEKEKKELRMRILQATLANDETVGRVYIVPPRWLIKSSAGKPSRKANRERIDEHKEFLVV